MNDKTLLTIGVVFALIGAGLNPMNWYENFKGAPSLSIYFFILLTVSGLLLAGYSIRGVLDKAGDGVL